MDKDNIRPQQISVFKKKLKKILKTENILELDISNFDPCVDQYENWEENSNSSLLPHIEYTDITKSLEDSQVSLKSKKMHRNMSKGNIVSRKTDVAETNMIQTISSILKTEAQDNKTNNDLAKTKSSKSKKLKRKLNITDNGELNLYNDILELDEYLANNIRRNITKKMQQQDISERQTGVDGDIHFDNNLTDKINSNIIFQNSVNANTMATKSVIDKTNIPLDVLRYNFSASENEKFNYKYSVVEIFDQPSTFGMNYSLNPNSIEHEEVEMADENLSDPISMISNEKNVDIPYKMFLVPNACVVILKQCSKLYFCGKLKASLIHGSVEVHGHRLTKKSEELYSVCTGSLLCFEALSCNGNIEDLIQTLMLSNIHIEKINAIIAGTSETDSVLLLEPLNNIMTDFVTKHLTNFDMFSRNKLIKVDDVFNLLQCSFYTEGEASGFNRNPVWNDILFTIENCSENMPRNVTMVCGGKNAGKSTLLRYLVNKRLVYGSVIVLDLDPGQPEFTICGSLSLTLLHQPLLGPNFTHLSNTERSLCLGYINVLENEQRYINAVIDLVSFCSNSEKYKNLPWIINTMGFVGTKGYNLLINIINIVHPTGVVEIQSSMPNQNFSTPLTADSISIFKNSNDYESYLEENWSMPAFDHKHFMIAPYDQQSTAQALVAKHIEAKSERLLNVLSYFSQMASEKYVSILNVKPYAVKLDTLALVFNNIHVEHDRLLCVLNGRLVALCQQNGNMNNPKISKLGNYPIVAHGYGLIRGIDPDKRLIYILTPLSADVLVQVNTLVYSNTLPDCASLLSVPNMASKMIMPFTTPLEVVSKHKHLHQIPKRKINPLRFIELGRKG